MSSLDAFAYKTPLYPIARHGDATGSPTGCQSPLPHPIKVAGCGSCGVDYLASVAAYPKPDEKLRSEQLEVQGGGNCANALTAAARLGLNPVIISKIGGDGLGDGIISELQADGVDTQLLLRASGHPSPFTYIIVDRQGGTRTCIHTPGAPMDPSEMTPRLMEAALEGAALVYFDGRLTEAALLLARAARGRGLPVLVEAERLRPGLELLLAEADYVVTSAHFPQGWTGEASVADAIVEMAGRLPRCQLFITTRGTQGSILLERGQLEAQGGDQQQQSLEEVLGQLGDSIQQQQQASSSSSSRPVDCLTATGLQLVRPPVAASQGVLRLGFSSSRDGASAKAAAAAAAERAAALNADAGNGDRYKGPSGSPSSGGLTARVVVAAAVALPKEAVADTTGAGDSFIGSVLYGLSTGLPLEHMLQLASVVAACKCTALGARPGLPPRSRLSAGLLSSPAPSGQAGGGAVAASAVGA